MPLYSYQAIGSDGKKLKSLIAADSLEAAKDKLRLQKYLLLGIKPHSLPKKNAISTQFALFFTRDIAQLVRAGIPLYESLYTLQQRDKGKKTEPLFLSLADSLKMGQSFSAALKHHPAVFDPIYIAMIEAAEESGALELILAKLAHMIENEQKQKRKLVSTLSYPVALMGFSVVVILSLFLGVIPNIKELFEGRKVQWITQVVMAISDFLVQYKMLIFVPLGIFLAAALLLFTQPVGKRLLSRLTLYLPLVRSIRTKAAMTRFSFSLSVLLKGGVTLVSAIELCKAVLRHPPLEALFTEALKEVRSGKKLSEQLAFSPWVSPLLLTMLKTAEEASDIAQMFENFATITEEELARDVQKITALLQPILLLTIGLVIGLVVLSVLIPLTDVGSMLD